MTCIGASELVMGAVNWLTVYNWLTEKLSVNWLVN